MTRLKVNVFQTIILKFAFYMSGNLLAGAEQDKYSEMEEQSERRDEQKSTHQGEMSGVPR